MNDIYKSKIVRCSQIKLIYKRFFSLWTVIIKQWSKAFKDLKPFPFVEETSHWCRWNCISIKFRYNITTYRVLIAKQYIFLYMRVIYIAFQISLSCHLLSLNLNRKTFGYNNMHHWNFRWQWFNLIILIGRRPLISWYRY